MTTDSNPLGRFLDAMRAYADNAIDKREASANISKVKLDITKPVQTKRGPAKILCANARVTYAGVPQPLIVEHQLESGRFELTTHTIDGFFLDKHGSDRDLVNIHEERLEVKLDHFYQIRNGSIAKAFFVSKIEAVSFNDKISVIDLSDEETYTCGLDGRCFADREYEFDLVRELTPTEVAALNL